MDGGSDLGGQRRTFVTRLTDAERAAQSLTHDYFKARALVSIAGALAATDPDRAERTAQSLTADYFKARAVASIAGAIGSHRP